uniref:Uncharacterized protein n=1 Tax=Periophthalmus magnuspinnatus TaxID=409849 RepID=A0A3B3ZEX1_9GOBI
MADCEASAESLQASRAEQDSLKLSELFERGWSALDELDSTQDPLSSHGIQDRVQRAIRGLETASRRVAQLELFSRNEELEEVCTSELKYLLLPALLGALTLKQTSRERRLEILQTARNYFVDYLQRCKNYNSEAVKMSGQAKIERYRQKKEVEAQLEAVKKAVESGKADEETSRQFYLLHLRRWISQSLEEVESIDQELPILKNMGALKSPRPPPPSRPPMRPFILTKDAVQAQVFGAGYPSLPTMTVDEWYSQHQSHHVLPDQGIPRKVAMEEDRDTVEVQEEQKEKQIETDDQESLQKARSWDDYKDTHRRGYGNRHNMG